MQLSESLFPCFNLHCQTPMILWFYWWRLTWGVRRSRSDQLRTSHQLWLLALMWHSELSFWYFLAFKPLTLCIHWITQRIPVLTNLYWITHLKTKHCADGHEACWKASWPLAELQGRVNVNFGAAKSTPAHRGSRKGLPAELRQGEEKHRSDNKVHQEQWTEFTHSKDVNPQ